MTPALLTRLRDHKAELLAMLGIGPETPTDRLAAFTAVAFVTERDSEAGAHDDLDWPAALADFVLLLAPDDLPAEPFKLTPWTTIVDRTEFLKWLQVDIRRGHTGPRARHGVLQTDLRHLRQRLRDLAQDARELINTPCESSK